MHASVSYVQLPKLCTSYASAICTPASIQRTAHPTCIHFAAYAPRASQRRTRRATTINLRLSTLAATVLFSRAMAHTGTTAGNHARLGAAGMPPHSYAPAQSARTT